MESKRWRWSVCICLMLVTALIAAGCGDDDEDSGSGGNAATQTEAAAPADTETETAAAEGPAATDEPLNEFGAGAEIPSDLPDSGLERAEAAVERYTQHPTQIPVTEPVGKPIPTGKTVNVLDCGIPFCASLVKGVEEAGNKLGWKTVGLKAGITPETIQKAWKTAVRNSPDAVIAFGYPRQLFQQQLSQLKAKDIPVVECCISEKPGDGILSILNPGPQGAQMAWWLTHDTQGKGANVLFVSNKDYPLIDQTFKPEFEAELKRSCPACKLSILNTPTTSYGTTLPNTIVSYLRSHKDIDYLALGAGPMAIGLPQALNAAGIKIPIVEDNPDIINQKQIDQGQESAGVAFPGQETMAQLVDILARHFAGVPIDPALKAPDSWILNKENMESTSEYPVIYTGYLEQYAALWGK